jgi:hypothetical protein
MATLLIRLGMADDKVRDVGAGRDAMEAGPRLLCDDDNWRVAGDKATSTFSRLCANDMSSQQYRVDELQPCTFDSSTARTVIGPNARLITLDRRGPSPCRFFFSLLAFPQPPVTELFTPTPLLAVRPAVLFGKWEPARARARMSAHA